MKDVKSLEKKDINEASEVLARAFRDDDFTKYILDGKKKKHEKLARIFQVALKFGLLYGEVYTTENLEAICNWFLPDQYKRPTWRWIRSGALGMLKEVGLNFLKRENPTTDLREELRFEHIKTPHWYLYAIGVDPKYQRKGYASALLKFMIENADRENIPIYLDTNTKENIPIYEHFGFKVLEKVILPTLPRKDIYNWCMVRF